MHTVSIKFSDFWKNVGKQYQKVSLKLCGKFCIKQICVQLIVFILEHVYQLRQEKLHIQLHESSCFCIWLAKKWKQKHFKTAWFCLLYLNELVAFSNCLPLGYIRHHGTFLLIVFELLSLSFSSGPYIAAFSASAWKGSQMSFRMASATPLEIQVERNRCSVILIFLILCFFILCVSEGPESWQSY